MVSHTHTLKRHTRIHLNTHILKHTHTHKQLELNVPSATPVQTHVDVGSNNPYKELCVLATDLGQPRLIYRFLAMPTTHAAWAGRRASQYAAAAAAGAEEEEERSFQAALAPLLPKLVPRLYRARFDPAQAVRQAMEPLWTTVAAGGGDAKAVEREYLPQIFEDLCEASGSRRWRERQAAVAGLADM